MTKLSLEAQLDLVAKVSFSAQDSLLSALVDSILKVYANDFTVVRQISLTLYNSGHLLWAEKLLNLCHQLNPYDETILYCLADIYQNTLRQRQAVKLYSELPFVSNCLMSMAYNPEDCTPSINKLIQQNTEHQAHIERPPRFASSSILRIGFVSGDLCQHPVGLYMIPLVEELAKLPNVRLFFFDNLSRDDWASTTLRKFGTWHNICNQSDLCVYKIIQDESISVLIDLSGHTARNRLSLFRLRPCSVQLTWLGYWSTTYLPNIFDSILVDSDVVPPYSFEANSFVEPIKYFAPTRWCYRPVPWMPDINLPPCLKNGYITFGCFNSNSKINHKLLNSWSVILSRTNNSMLFLKNYQLKDKNLREFIVDFFAANGINPSRIILEGPSIHLDLLSSYQKVDIGLDTFPFNGGLTSCEALWMGLPLVTQYTSNHPAAMAARQGLSLLNILNRREWIASTTEEYIDIACSLSGRVDYICDIRSSQRDLMSASPLCDARAFTNHFLSALMEICESI